MLPVSTVYVYWRYGDMVDAYLRQFSGLNGSQVIMIRPSLGRQNYFILWLLCADGLIRYTYMSGHSMLNIREDVEGVAA